MSTNKRFVLTFTFFTALLIVSCIAFMSARFIILEQGDQFSDPGYPCGRFPPNITSFSATKQVLSQWHWKYSFDQLDGKITHHCPNRGVNVYMDHELSARALNEGKKEDKKVTIFDCHEHPMAVIRIGKRDTNILGKPIETGMEIRAMNGQVIAFTEGHHDWTDEITIKDVQGNEIAYLERRKYSLDWRWEFTIFNTLHFGADPRLLSALAGEIAFDSTTHSDSCNNFYNLTLYISIGSLILLFCIICGCLFACYERGPYWYCNDLKSAFCDGPSNGDKRKGNGKNEENQPLLGTQ